MKYFIACKNYTDSFYEVGAPIKEYENGIFRFKLLETKDSLIYKEE